MSRTPVSVSRPSSLLTVGAILAALAACTGDTPAPAEPEPPAAATPALPDALPADDLAGGETYAKVPPPGELQIALQKAGIETELATLVPDRTFQLTQTDADRVAVRTGVVIGDILLTVKTSDDAKLVSQLDMVEAGMKTLDGGSDIVATIEDLKERVTAKAVERSVLLTELDELAQVAIPELEFNGRSRIVPLIQAGSWLSGANLVAQAVKAKGTPAAADAILKQPEVVGYFQSYAKDKSAETPSVVSDALQSSLGQLATVASKEGSLDEGDIDTVVSSTEAVLALL